MSPVILFNTPGQGGRGAAPKGSGFELAGRIATQPGVFVLEPRDVGSDSLIPYRLDPFFPFISLTDSTPQNPPLVPLKLPGGTIGVVVRKPSGALLDLGTHSLLQAQIGEPTTSSGFDLDFGGIHPGNFLQLTNVVRSHAVPH